MRGLTDSAGRQPDAWPEARPPPGKIVRALLRALGSTAALVVIYYLLPLDHASTGAAITMLVIGLVALIALVVFPPPGHGSHRGNGRPVTHAQHPAKTRQTTH